MLAEICVDAVLCSGEEENGFGFDTVKVFVTNGYEVPKFLKSLQSVVNDHIRPKLQSSPSKSKLLEEK